MSGLPPTSPCNPASAQEELQTQLVLARGEGAAPRDGSDDFGVTEGIKQGAEVSR